MHYDFKIFALVTTPQEMKQQKSILTKLLTLLGENFQRTLFELCKPFMTKRMRRQ